MKTMHLLGLVETLTSYVYIGMPPCGQTWILHVSFHVTSESWRWLDELTLFVLLLCRLWMWLAWGPSARRCCAIRPVLCLQPSATSTHWRSPSFKGTRLQQTQMKTRKMRMTLCGRNHSTLRPPAWALAGTPHVIMALRSRPTWLTSESASPLLLVPSPNTSSNICSLTPATGSCFLFVNSKVLHYNVVLHNFVSFTCQQELTVVKPLDFIAHSDTCSTSISISSWV